MSPIREWECPACGYRFERIEWSNEYELPECPRCREEWKVNQVMEKVISVPASPQFKGTGWTKPTRGEKS
jgi:putative FmdB family regulatory protein